MTRSRIPPLALIGAVLAQAQAAWGQQSQDIQMGTLDSSTLISVMPPAYARSIVIGPSGISMDMGTGEVTIPKDLTLSDAAKKFWNAMAMVRGQPALFPEVEP